MKLDLGCGKECAEGFEGVDLLAFEGAKWRVDLGRPPWPWLTEQVDEVRAFHLVEHLTWPQRIVFFNELYRVLKPGGTAVITVPHWCNQRYYGDPTHQAPISEHAVYYLSRGWREECAPHAPYTCDFNNSLVHCTMAPGLEWMPPWARELAARFLRDAAHDLVFTLTK